MKSVLFNNTGELSISIDSAFPDYDNNNQIKYGITRYYQQN